MALNDISNIEESLLNAYDVNYGDLPPEIAYYINMPGTNPNKVLEWFNLGLAEPQTFNQARLLAEAVGYSPEQAKVVAGQWQMESSGGSRLSSPYNYFGIKSHNEAVRNKLAERGIDVSAGKEAKTKEGKGKAIKSSFMEFKNAFEGFAAHKAFLESNQRYQKALAASTAKDFAVGLQKAGYATAENYGIRLYNDFVKPKELNPKSGDTRPKSFGETKSEKIKPFNLNANYKQETVEKLPLFAPPMLDAEGEVSLEPTMGQGMYGSTAYKQELEAETPIKMSAKPGSFGSGKLNFNNGGTMNFKSKEAYQKWLAYGHASGEFAKTRGNQPVSIKEKSHKVEHAYGGHMYAAGGSFNNPGFNALPVSVQNKIKANSFADGGQMGNPLTEFNAGGSHEENPLGGIPQGMAPDGRMNLVEQGETKLDAANYIFSDNLKVTKQIVEDFNLPKKLIGKTFAAASKTLDLPNSRRENDTIETNYKRKTLETLMNAQEVFKQEQMAADMAAMFEKYPEQMSAIMQQNAAPGGQMTEGAPQQMPEQGMPAPEPVPTSQLPMSYGGSMYMKGGRMCADGGALYNYGGNLYDFGGTMRSIGAGAYGVGEGMLDTLTFGLTDSLTDKGYNALSKVGKTRTAEELERDRMIRGFGNTAGAITGAVVSGGATTGSAISEGSEGLGEGLTNIKGTGEDFDKTVNALAQMGSMAGSFVGGNPTAAANSPEFVQTLMKAKENPLLNQGINMLDQGIGMAEIRKNGGPIYHQYNQLTDQWKNNAGPMGQGLTNTQMYAVGGHMYDGETLPSGFLKFKPKSFSYQPQAENLMANSYAQNSWQNKTSLPTIDFTGAGETELTIPISTTNTVSYTHLTLPTKA